MKGKRQELGEYLSILSYPSVSRDTSKAPDTHVLQQREARPCQDPPWAAFGESAHTKTCLEWHCAIVRCLPGSSSSYYQCLSSTFLWAPTLPSFDWVSCSLNQATAAQERKICELWANERSLKNSGWLLTLMVKHFEGKERPYHWPLFLAWASRRNQTSGWALWSQLCERWWSIIDQRLPCVYEHMGGALFQLHHQSIQSEWQEGSGEKFKVESFNFWPLWSQEDRPTRIDVSILKVVPVLSWLIHPSTSHGIFAQNESSFFVKSSSENWNKTRCGCSWPDLVAANN